MEDSDDSQSWIRAWKEGRTNFHRSDYHEKLIRYFPGLHPKKGQRVFVPLCGKSKDMIWLRNAGLEVYGVELYEGAVRAFFEENGLPVPQTVQEPDFMLYSSGDIHVRCGDFFQLRDVETYHFVYDRGALVAMPPALREKYAERIGRSLKKGGKYLLIAYEYDPTQMQGPPHSLTEDEIRRLYGDRFSVRLLENERPSGEGPRLSAVESLRQTVYVLEKRSDLSR